MRYDAMNLIAPFALALLLAASTPVDAPAAAPRAASVCLNVRDIQRTETPDDRTILFHMRDGKVWSNTLKTVCPMLKFSSFTEVLNDDQLCGNQQFIRVTLTGDQCVLGDFTPVAAQH
jgi:hypothetical protein